MRPKADQRVKEDLDLFLLALIEEGIATPYRMQTAAGISQGTSLQSLSRLAERKLVRATEEGPRRRTEFQLTAAGRRWLERGSSALAEVDPVGDLDSILRKGLLIAFKANDRKRASEFLQAAAEDRLGREPDPIPAPLAVTDMAELYLGLRQAQAESILKTEAAVLKRAAAEITHLPKQKR